jgi:TrmH family RNA methyltransferase
MGVKMITSISNQKVKYLVNLQKKRKLRDENGVFITEGIRIFRELPLELIEEVFVSEKIKKDDLREINTIIDKTSKKNGTHEHRVHIETLSEEVFEYISDTKTPQGSLCVVKQVKYALEDIVKKSNNEGQKLYLVLDTLQDPGNMGTILRTAEAAGVTAVIMNRQTADIYSPKVVRSTMGSIFRVPFVVVEDLCSAIDYLQKSGVAVYATELNAKNSYDEADYTNASAFLIGNEGNGLSQEVKAKANKRIGIPMLGEVESLNAAVATSVLLFEAARQRRH